MNKLSTAFEKLLKEQNELKQKFQKEGQALFKDAFLEFFDKNPNINAVMWNQYTPYFNDGDECVFSVGGLCFTNAKDDGLDDVRSYGEYEGENETIWAADGTNALTSDRPYYKETQDKVAASGGVDIDSCIFLEKLILDDAMGEILKALFDDHTKIIATRSGFDVSEYEHD